MKTNRVRAQATHAAKSSQARKTTGQTLPPAAAEAPQLPSVSAEQLDRLTAARHELQTHNDKAQGLFYLLSTHFEMRAVINAKGGTETCDPHGDEATGIMLLGQDVTRGLSACHDELHRLALELGQRELARVRLAQLDAGELKAEMAATGERMRALRQRLLDGGLSQDAVDEMTGDLLNGGAR